MPGDDPEAFLDVAHAARRAGRSPETIRRWVWSGRLPAQRQRGRILVRRDDLLEIAPQDGPGTAPSLAEWAEAARIAIGGSAPPRAGSAAGLVLADRRRDQSSASEQ